MSNQPLVVLFVDDYRDTLDLYGFMLESEGMSCLYAQSALEGLRLAQERQPDVIVVDLQMPKFDGTWLLEAIHADPGIRAPRIVVLTADVRESVASDIKQRFNPDGYCVKPCLPEELVTLIRSALNSDSPGAP